MFTESADPRRNKAGDNMTHRKCVKLLVRGVVQGVGFRPFVYRLATEMGLTGWVCNSNRGVEIELDGPVGQLSHFINRLETETPPLASIQYLETSFCDPAGYVDFVVRESPATGEKSVLVLPDMGTCSNCLNEIFDPNDRRYRYPFANCTNCGPRFSIVESLPYDRARTTMKGFAMCEECRAEYEDPRNRRFHAQPNACPTCGPHLELWDASGKMLAGYDDAMQEAGEVVRKGGILALKGLGGFQLLVDASNDDAVRRLRRRKAREEKPLALMYSDLDSIKHDCEITETEKRLLQSPQAPIVLVRRRPIQNKANPEIAPSVAPGNPYLGVMLPYTPLHHLLMRNLGFPVVATSGNITDEPICIDEHEALKRLGNIADMFLVHNRPIARQMDDSVVQIVNGHVQVLRNARGYAPSSITLKKPVKSCLAVGAHLKNSAAVANNNQAFLSQHVGDLETPQAYRALDQTIKSLSGLYDHRPEISACDLHPDYASTKYAAELGLPLIKVQHHHAHVLSCMADNEIEGPVLGVAWDGTGLGTDGTIWGGEFLLVEDNSICRKAYLRTFPLPGGEAAVREPRRAAIGILYEIFGRGLFDMTDLSPLAAFTDNEKKILRQMLGGKVNCPVCSSAGRLFDAVASILNICHRNIYNGQAAMMLSFTAEEARSEEVYSFTLLESDGIFIVDWEPMIRCLINDLENHKSLASIAAKFHNTLTEMIVTAAERIGMEKVVLTGGCFQNRYLAERTIRRLESKGFMPYQHRRIPPNDGGIALGQIIAVQQSMNGDK